MMTDDGYRNRKFAPAYVPAPKQIVAKFASKCAECGAVIEAGATILWTPGQYKARVTHVACPAPAPKEAPVTEPAPAPAKPAPVLPSFSQPTRTLSDADLEAALLASEPGSPVEAVLLAEIDRRMEEADANDGADSYTGEDDLTERAIEARNDEWASRETALDEAPLAPRATPAQARAAEAAFRAEDKAMGAPLLADAPARIAVEDAGVYALPDGTVVRVKANKAKTRTYASRWTPTKHLDRLMEAGAHEHGEYVYEQGLVAEVARSGRKLTLEEAKAHSIRYGQCVRCGRALRDGKSVEQGMGPVCIRYFQG
jgi:hypothetical protein